MKKLIYILPIFVLLTTACSESWLDTKSSTSLDVEGSITTVTQAQYAVDGVYDQLTSSDYYNSDFIAPFDVQADDMRAAGAGRLEGDYKYTFYTESSKSTRWVVPYRALKNLAALMSVIDEVKTDGDTEKNKLNDIKGQALALRGLVHFDLVRVFGKPYTHGGADQALGVPIVIEPMQSGDKLARNTVAEVYTQVVKDLTAGIELLSTDANAGHINKWAAKALLSRVYLYMGDNTNALALAKDVIDNSKVKLVERSAYVKSWADDKMSEALFELINSSEDNGGLESVGYLSDPDGYGQFVAADDFITLMKSDANDVRANLLVADKLGTDAEPRLGRVLKYPGKDNSPSYTTNIRVIRLSEVYLNAAEAAVKLGQDASTYLNAIYKRATGVDVTGTIDLDRVLLERRKELVAEGHRFFDLVRNNKTIVRGSDYWGPQDFKTIESDNFKVIQPIPRIELDANPNMKQNPGYES
ncbi:RagB/SusD family nutrient uptake outer membrane protein [Prolixibacteraceae bacterium JC049]|nr:RagB/SusD family nutrient uptake outer membrane protein [Prolixibacteraceae bacterium JC049]